MGSLKYILESEVVFSLSVESPFAFTNVKSWSPPTTSLPIVNFLTPSSAISAT